MCVCTVYTHTHTHSEKQQLDIPLSTAHLELVVTSGGALELTLNRRGSGVLPSVVVPWPDVSQA